MRLFHRVFPGGILEVVRKVETYQVESSQYASCRLGQVATTDNWCQQKKIPPHLRSLVAGFLRAAKTRVWCISSSDIHSPYQRQKILRDFIIATYCLVRDSKVENMSIPYLFDSPNAPPHSSEQTWCISSIADPPENSPDPCAMNLRSMARHSYPWEY